MTNSHFWAQVSNSLMSNKWDEKNIKFAKHNVRIVGGALQEGCVNLLSFLELRLTSDNLVVYLRSQTNSQTQPEHTTIWSGVLGVALSFKMKSFKMKLHSNLLLLFGKGHSDTQGTF